MAINFGAEYKRFEKEMAKKHELYAQLGMSKEEFLSDNTYKRHVQSLSIDEDSGNPEDLHPLFKKFGDVLSVELKVTFRDKYAWLDEISSPELTKKLLSLAPEDLELLDAYVFGEKTQVELAKKNGISQKNISKKLNRIRRFLAEE
jgi:DNA-directed RNA polymerase specialized sigma subunit